MNNKVFIGVVLIIVLLAAALFVQNHKLRTELNTLEKQQEQAKQTPPDDETKPANPAGASPFDKPNIDPLADEFAPTTKGKTPTTSIRFDNLAYDFGRITAGQKVRTKFKFYNTGEHQLLIYHCQASCGCTVPDWPKYPVKPGDSAEIDVEFNSSGKQGEITKTVTVSTNCTIPMITLSIKATVIPQDK